MIQDILCIFFIRHSLYLSFVEIQKWKEKEKGCALQCSLLCLYSRQWVSSILKVPSISCNQFVCFENFEYARNLDGRMFLATCMISGP